VTDRSALEQRLQRLASAGFGDGAVRTIRAGDPDGLLRAILFEADTVVMPRELRLEGASGAGLALEVANRRVLRARAPTGGAGPAPMDPGDPEAQERLRKMLLAMLGAGAEVRVQHTTLGRDIDPAEPGISVGAIAESWGLPLSRPPREDDASVLDAFLSACDDDLPAWVMIAGEVSESFGDDDLVEGLIALSKSGLAERLRDRSGRDEWRFAAVGPFVEEAPFRAIAALGSTLFVMAIGPGRFGKVTDRWRRALA
jgi:hypothetical protein